MAVVLRSSATGPATQPGSSGIFTMPKPAAVSHGDLLVAVFYQSQNGEPNDVAGVNQDWFRERTLDATWIGNAIVLTRYVDDNEPSFYTFRTTASSIMVGTIGAFGKSGGADLNGVAITNSPGILYQTTASTSHTTGVAASFSDEALRVCFWLAPTGGDIHGYTLPTNYNSGVLIQSSDLREQMGLAHFNLCLNPYFAFNTNDWTPTVNTTLTRQTGASIPGTGITTYGRMVKHTATSDMLAFATGRTNQSPNTQFVARAWVRASAAVDIQIAIDFYNSVGGWISTAATAPPVAANTWTEIELTTTSPAGTKDVLLSVGRYNVPVGTTIEFTDVLLNTKFATGNTNWNFASGTTGYTGSNASLTYTADGGVNDPTDYADFWDALYANATHNIRIQRTTAGTGTMYLVSNNFTLPTVTSGEQIMLDTIIKAPAGGGNWYAIIDQLDGGGALIDNAPLTPLTLTAGVWTRVFTIATKHASATQYRVVIGSTSKAQNTQLDIGFARCGEHRPGITAVSSISAGYIAGTFMVGHTAGPQRTGSASTELPLSGSADSPNIYMEAPSAALLTLGTAASGDLSYTGTGLIQLDLGSTSESYKLSEGCEPAILVLGQIHAGFNPAPSTSVVHVDEPPKPLPKLTRRYIAQDILSREILHWDVPLSDDQVTVALSAPHQITGKIEPDMARELTLGSERVLEPWRTMLHCEDNGSIIASCLLLPGSMEYNSYDVNCEGYTTYPHGIPYLGDYSKTDVDPIDVFHEIWRHLQDYPLGKLGVQIQDKVHSAARLGNERENQDDPNSPMKPYTLSWWDNKDCGSTIDELARTAPFEYVEKSWWADDTRSDVKLFLDIASPRAGTYRDYLRFAEGENIVDAVTLTEPDDWYADTIVGQGAGEGREKIQELATGPQLNHRVRRVYTYLNERITDKEQLKKIIKREAASRGSVHEIASITIDSTHPNALRGSFGPGDDILVQIDIPWVGEVAIKHRIMSYTHDTATDLMKVELKRSDSFLYGPEAPTSGGSQL